MPSSPLFPTIYPTFADAHELRVCTTDSGITLRLQQCCADHAIQCGDLTEAEDRVFDLAVEELTYDVTDFMSSPLSIIINRTANRIAAKTRRGTGNVAFMHPDGAKLMKEGQFGYRQLPDSLMALGAIPLISSRWTDAGMVHSSIALYSSADLPRHLIYVAYVGENFDTPAKVVADNGLYTVYPMMPETDAVASTSDYLHCIRLTGGDFG